MKKGTIFLFLILAVGQGIAAKPLTVGTMWFPPYYVIVKEGNTVKSISGINVEIVSRVLNEIKADFVLKDYPTARLYTSLEKGIIDVFYGIRVPENMLSENYVYYSRNKISKITLRVFSLGETKIIQKKEDLVGQKIIVFRGYGYGGFIDYVRNPENNMIAEVADTQEYGFRMLKKGRARYLLAFEEPAWTVIKTFPDNYLSDLKWSPPLFEAPGYFIVSKKTPNAEDLIQKMDEAFERLDKSGAFGNLIVK